MEFMMLPLFVNCTKKGNVHDHAVGQEQPADASAGVLADAVGDIGLFLPFR
jgi:hypothetical protein